MSDGKPTFDAVFEMGIDWQPIARQARLVWTLGAMAVAAPILILLVVGLAQGGGPIGGVVGLCFALAVAGVLRWLVVRRHRSWGYSIRDDELVLRRGVVIRRLTIVPIGRMQFIDIHQGPLDRWLGVANLQLHTAAAASDAKIPMLVVDVAGRVRDELVRRGAGRSAGT